MLIDGKQIASEMLMEVKEKVSKMAKPLRLAAVLVGDHAESRKFLEMKKRVAGSVGIDFELYEFPENITTQKLRKEIVGLVRASVNDGIIIELPLPSQINTQYILNAVPEEKDPDVLSQKSMGAFFSNRSPILPPSVETVKQIFEKYNIDPKGKTVAVFGYGLLIGKPISHWLLAQNATVSIINEFTSDPELISKQADIIISGVGLKPNLITSGMVKSNAIVIDFAQDVDFENVSKKASLITPPIGGCGPIVIASVLKNLVSICSV
jgi:methylenetetrahydrofolate dehydrogenase (NADP+) / methenyltetrahydrofolate cyclohydrolase